MTFSYGICMGGKGEVGDLRDTPCKCPLGFGPGDDTWKRILPEIDR